MARRDVGEINAGSMADIAFLLLIFFLVTTTMDVDSGIARKLPPPPEPNQEQDDSKIKDRNIFVVLINKNNKLLVENEPLDIRYLKEKAKEFIENPLDKDNLPEKNEKEVDFFGKVMVSKGIISLQNDRGTSYGTYITVQNELAAAYNELRNELAMRRFGRNYADCNKDQQKAIQKVFPQKISEAEPKNIGGE
jgi:biopolymer transport protein ExbD